MVSAISNFLSAYQSGWDLSLWAFPLALKKSCCMCSDPPILSRPAYYCIGTALDENKF
jgi:hypothetical protein